jgi:hypothetical protein
MLALWMGSTEILQDSRLKRFSGRLDVMRWQLMARRADKRKKPFHFLQVPKS